MPRNRDGEKWLAHAKRARERAIGMRDDASKRTLLDIAGAYDNLAKRAESLTNPVTEPDPEKPA